MSTIRTKLAILATIERLLISSKETLLTTFQRLTVATFADIYWVLKICLKNTVLLPL